MKIAPVLLTALLPLGASPALADNHFLLEAQGGLTSPLGVDAHVDEGAAFGGTFGFGGRIKGFAPAYYLIGTLGRAGYDFTGPPSYGSAHVERDQIDWSLGGRIYLPVSERLRVLAQVGFGETYDKARVSRAGYRTLLLDTEVFTVQTQVGLQYRLSDALSLGLKGELSFYPDSEELRLAGLSAGLGDDDEGGYGRAGIALTTTFHF